MVYVYIHTQNANNQFVLLYTYNVCPQTSKYYMWYVFDVFKSHKNIFEVHISTCTIIARCLFDTTREEWRIIVTYSPSRYLLLNESRTLLKVIKSKTFYYDLYKLDYVTIDDKP